MNELDNFDEIENQGFKQQGINLSNVYSVRTGGFGTDEFIKTYLATLNVAELQSDVSLYETLSQDKEWPVSQIIQREVDKSRINEIAKKYLAAQGRDVKYFPPIIVALLPREIDGSFSKTYNYPADQSDSIKELVFDKSAYSINLKFKELLIAKKNDSLVDGLYFYNTSQVFEHNILCWDKVKFYAVVIDGQHRLEALLKAREENSAFYSAIQDVIFLDVSRLVKTKSSLTPVQVLRTVFIDINTNAKSVGLVRRILMDDKDLASLCVQSLVESVNRDGTSKEPDCFIPSALIDWHGDSLKHELPHLTGLLTLHQIISDELVGKRLVTIDDHRNKSKITNFINILNSYFFVDSTIKSKSEFSEVVPLETSFNTYLQQKEISREVFAQEMSEDDYNGLDSILFTYDYRVLEVAQENFENFYLKAIVQIFKQAKPYAEVIEKLSELNAFDVQSNLYKSLLANIKKLIVNSNLRDKYLEVRRILFEEFNPKYYLFYTVVGQKGVFNRFFETLLNNLKIGSTESMVISTKNIYVENLNEVLDILDYGDINLFGKDDFFIDTDSKLDEFGTVASSFWEGILFEDKRIIYNSQGVRAFADVLRFLSDVYTIIKSGDDINEFNKFAIRFSTQRTKRLLSKRFSIYTDVELEQIASTILLNKKTYLIEVFRTAFTNYESSK
ncbi:ParB N-terminal domain-containing protein [Spirosoma jeollabukense]